MKPRISALILMAVLAGLGSATVAFGSSDQPAQKPAASAAVTGTPVTVVAESRYEFKPVVDGSEVTHEYRVKNTGDGPLAIERVRTG